MSDVPSAPSPPLQATSNTIGPATYTVPDIALLAKASERHIWRLADQDKIPGRIKGLGRLVRYSRSAVDAWLAGNRTAGKA
jgi:predicted DNA-binding transcriptional regulator AlpA